MVSASLAEHLVPRTTYMRSTNLRAVHRRPHSHPLHWDERSRGEVKSQGYLG